MPNQPKTPVSNFRLTDEDKENLNKITKAFRGLAEGLTKTDALRKSVEAFAKLSEALNTDSYARNENGDLIADSYGDPVPNTEVSPHSRMCPLGMGHTAHVWELPAKIYGHAEPQRYLCYGQPFADGYDQYNDRHHLNAYVTTNPPRVEWVDDGLKRSLPGFCACGKPLSHLDADPDVPQR